MANLLDVAGLTARYGATAALHGIDFFVREGGVTAILGAYGAGKTTTLRAVSGLVSVGGSILLTGRPIAGRRPEAVARLGVAHVPDGRGTFDQLTVEENLELGGYTVKRRTDVKSRMDEMYTLFPVLASRHRQQAGTLSGGEQQMLAIARALMMQPRLLLLDEPSFGLAPLIVEEIFGIMQRIRDTQKVGILLVEQNANHALRLAHRGYVMVNGLITLRGTGAELLAQPEVRAAYLEGGRQI